MKSLWHWLTELAEVYARHAGRHGPNRLLPAEMLPAHEHVPEHTEPSPQGAGPDGGTWRSPPHSSGEHDRHSHNGGLSDGPRGEARGQR
jgi:hypothetical protein